MRKFVVKICQKCGREYLPTCSRQRWCAECKIKGWQETKKRWEALHPKRQAPRKKAWDLANPEKKAVAIKAWRMANPDTVKEYGKKKKAKRRTLGFVSLNVSFAGCDAHHVDKEHVVHIPKELHQSIAHNVFTGKNMAEINAKACAWLTEGWT